MRWLGLIALTAFLQPALVVPLAGRARRERWLICRTESRIVLGSWVVAFAASLYIAATPPHSVFFDLNSGLVCFTWGWAVGQCIRYWLMHREHDEDCRYGPRRRRGGATTRLVQWRKVALNPAFSPT